MARQIWYSKKEVRKLFLIWLPVFALLAFWNISVAGNDRHGSVPVLNGMNVFLLIPYWGACLVYTLVLFVFLRDGQRFWRFPVFIMLQLVWLVCDQGADAADFVRGTWDRERYVLAPFAYSVVVYTLAQVLRNRLHLYQPPQEENESPEP